MEWERGRNLPFNQKFFFPTMSFPGSSVGYWNFKLKHFAFQVYIDF